MPKLIKSIVLLFLLCLAACTTGQATPPATATPPMTNTPVPPTPLPTSTPEPPHARPLLMAHYMPWYQTPEVSGYWGWHWTMNHFDPAQTDADGHPQIASHFMPLTGPYDSNDDALLEYQVLLMKLSGIDGVIVDWYGTEDFWDYAVLNRSTGKLFEHIKKAGLLFSICYEDQTIKHMVDNKHIVSDKDIYTRGQEDMRYLQDTWFQDDAYLKASGQPVLFIFGPQYFTNAADWETLFTRLDPRPAFITLDKMLYPAAIASYPWPPMGQSVNGVLSQQALERYLNEFYDKTSAYEYVVAGAFPGFYDIYKEAGVGAGYGFLDAQQGQTLEFTLQTALAQYADVVQLITWNDYGEGTNIEPTEEFGYQYLEIVQNARRASDTAGFSYTASDLELPLQLYNLRKKYASNAEINARLDEAAAAIISGDLPAARSIIVNVEDNP